MPGPGGGGRSGGGGRGGFHGGGGFGGGRGGFHGGHYHRPFMGGFWGFGPRYYGGGCLGGLISMALAPIIFGILAVVLLISVVFSGISEISQGGTVRYNEQALQAYADGQYAEIFADSAYEDNILLVVLTEDENAYDYYYIAWVGDHIAGEVHWLFGDDRSYLGRVMDSNISDTNYTYSLDSDLGRVITAMAQEMQEMALPSNHICQEDRSQAPSRLYNYTALPMTEETVNYALEQFTSRTGIPCSIVVADMEDVFDRGLSGGTIIMLILLAIVVIMLVVSLVKKNRRKQDPDNDSRRNDRYQDPY